MNANGNNAAPGAMRPAVEGSPRGALTPGLPLENPVRVLFVHGMGRTPASGWPLLWQLRRAGLATATFGYMASMEDFAAVAKRLALKIAAIAQREEYVVVGHSLGGVLARAALNALPPQTRAPRHLFLLGSPVRPSRLAGKLRANPLFRVLTRDCGQLLGSESRMAGIGPVAVATTSIAGIKGLAWQRGPFGSEANDGVVALSEVSADWLAGPLQVPVVHTLLPSSALVARHIIERLQH